MAVTLPNRYCDLYPSEPVDDHRKTLPCGGWGYCNNVGKCNFQIIAADMGSLEKRTQLLAKCFEHPNSKWYMGDPRVQKLPMDQQKALNLEIDTIHRHMGNSDAYKIHEVKVNRQRDLWWKEEEDKKWAKQYLIVKIIWYSFDFSSRVVGLVLRPGDKYPKTYATALMVFAYISVYLRSPFPTP